MAFVPTTDFARARAFYEGILGLRFLSQNDFAIAMEANGIMIRIAKVAEFTPAPFTILGWRVTDIDATVAKLRKKGVRFQVYDFPGLDENGIWTAPGGARVAWFKDPDGNVLSVTRLPAT